MKVHKFFYQTQKLYRIGLASTLGRAYLALTLLLGGSALLGLEMISQGAWGWYLLVTVLVIQLSLIWRAQDRQSELWGRPEIDDGIPMMHTHRMHIIAHDLMEGELDITPTDGSEIF
jgi:hypothetical protein